MKQSLERFFNLPFEKLLKTRSEFTLHESMTLQPEISAKAMAYFNLAKEWITENNPEYKEALKIETEYLSGSWGL